MEWLWAAYLLMTLWFPRRFACGVYGFIAYVYTGFQQWYLEVFLNYFYQQDSVNGLLAGAIFVQCIPGFGGILSPVIGAMLAEKFHVSFTHAFGGLLSYFIQVFWWVRAVALVMNMNYKLLFLADSITH